MQRNDKLETFLRQQNIKFNYNISPGQYELKGKILMNQFRELIEYLNGTNLLIAYINGDLIIH